jgi:hypothetical protein
MESHFSTVLSVLCAFAASDGSQVVVALSAGNPVSMAAQFVGGALDGLSVDSKMVIWVDDSGNPDIWMSFLEDSYQYALQIVVVISGLATIQPERSDCSRFQRGRPLVQTTYCCFQQYDGLRVSGEWESWRTRRPEAATWSCWKPDYRSRFPSRNPSGGSIDWVAKWCRALASSFGIDKWGV